MKITTLAMFLLVATLAMSAKAQPHASTNPHWTAPCNVVWTSPSHDATGSMPMGNGQVGINIWVEEDGNLRFYISRTDSLSEVSRLLKVGGVRVSLDPNPFKKGMPFRQELDLADGMCQIIAGKPEHQVMLEVFVDPQAPVINVIGRAASSLKVKVSADVWRKTSRELTGEELNSSWTLHGSPTPVIESADVFPPLCKSAVAWYHRNEKSPAFASTLKVQSLESAADKVRDPLLHRTFGGFVTAAGLASIEPHRPCVFGGVEEHSLTSPEPLLKFAIRIAAPCLQCETAEKWLDAARILAAGHAVDTDADRLLACSSIARVRTAADWHAFWGRSWVVVDGDGAADVPGGTHPLRIGYDSNGGNRFPGQIEYVRVFATALPQSEIIRLKGTRPARVSHPRTDLLVSRDGTPGEIDLGPTAIRQAFTLEARIRPTNLTPGRIFDRLTAGGSDGFLFDTHPGDTLRLIVGSAILSAPQGILRAGQSYHVAATYGGDSGAMRIYIDGRLAAQVGSDASSSVTEGYTLQRDMQACGGRGPYPIKFNGGMFTVEPKPFGKPYNADWRAWGDCHWWQNVRHMYHPMLAAGDFEMTDPLFAMYERACLWRKRVRGSTTVRKAATFRKR